MSDYKDDYIKYRIEKCDEALDDANLLYQNERLSACVNRLYYACYYIVSSLLLKCGIKSDTHAGLKTQFNLHFVKTEIVSKEMGKLYSDLMNMRQQGDYGDMYDFDKNAVEDILLLSNDFINRIKELL
jgi:uncharacterized protein (UPF0332 family)